jgi:hypothetical protein
MRFLNAPGLRPTWRFRSRRLAAATVIASLLWAASVGTVAAAGCDPHGQDVTGTYFAYALRNVAGISAIRGQLLEYRPYVPFEMFRTRVTSAWVMLAGPGANNFAQIGWYEWSLNYRRIFLQYWDGQGWPLREYDPAPDWTYQEYSVSYVGQPAQFRFYHGRTVNPLWSAAAAFVPGTGEIASEISNQLNQMPGDLGAISFMKWTAMEVRVAGVFQAFAPAAVSTSDNTKWYSSNQRGGMDPLRELVTADRRGDCA